MTDEEIDTMIPRLADLHRGRDGKTDLKAVRADLKARLTNPPEAVIRWVVGEVARYDDAWRQFQSHKAVLRRASCVKDS